MSKELFYLFKLNADIRKKHSIIECLFSNERSVIFQFQGIHEMQDVFDTF